MKDLAAGNMRRLQAFVAVVDHRSFSAAARALGISQPAVTRHVQEMERDTKVKLIDRGQGWLVLTDVGETAYRYARQIVALADNMEQELASASGAVTGTVRVGGSDIWSYVLPRLLGEFQRQHPRVAVKLAVRTSREIAGMVQGHELGLGFISYPVVSEDLEVEKVGTYPFLLAGPPDHPLAGQGRVLPRELNGVAFVQYQTELQTPLATTHYLAGLGIMPNLVMELGRLEAIKEAVKAGFGLSLLPSFTIEHDLATSQLVQIKLDAPPCTGELYMLRDRRRYISPAQHALLRHVITGLLPYAGGAARARPPRSTTGTRLDARTLS